MVRRGRSLPADGSDGDACASSVAPDYFANFYTIDVEEFPAALSGFVRVEADALGDYAVSRLTELYLERIGTR